MSDFKTGHVSSPFRCFSLAVRFERDTVFALFFQSETWLNEPPFLLEKHVFCRIFLSKSSWRVDCERDSLATLLRQWRIVGGFSQVSEVPYNFRELYVSSRIYFSDWKIQFIYAVEQINFARRNFFYQFLLLYVLCCNILKFSRLLRSQVKSVI